MKKGIGAVLCVALVLTIAINLTMIIKGIFFETMPSVFGYIPLVATETIESADIARGDLIICKESGEGIALNVTTNEGDYSGYAIYTGHKIVGIGALSDFLRTPQGLAAIALLVICVYLMLDDDVFYPSRRRLEVK